MVKHRGYNIEDYEFIYDFEPSDYETYLIEKIKTNRFLTVKESLNTIYTKDSDNTKCYVFYISKDEKKKKISKQVLIELKEIVEKDPLARDVIVIGDKEINPPTKNFFRILKKTYGLDTEPKWIFFESKELTYNPTEHVDVSAHRLLSKEEEQNLLKELKIPKTKLPLILADDRIVKHYGWEPGNIIEVIREEDDFDFICPLSKNYRYITSK
jgi:DNA-directed RNA polymerase subunit H (RpoH/RPB5)